MATSGSDDRKIAPKSKGWLGRVGHTPRSERVDVGVERAWKRVTWADHEENQTLCQGLAPIVLVDRFHRSVPDPDMDTDTEAHTPIVVSTAARRCTADLMVQASNHLQTGPDDDPTISPYGSLWLRLPHSLRSASPGRAASRLRDCGRRVLRRRHLRQVRPSAILISPPPAGWLGRSDDDLHTAGLGEWPSAFVLRWVTAPVAFGDKSGGASPRQFRGVGFFRDLSRSQRTTAESPFRSGWQRHERCRAWP